MTEIELPTSQISFSTAIIAAAAAAAGGAWYATLHGFCHDRGIIGSWWAFLLPSTLDSPLICGADLYSMLARKILAAQPALYVHYLESRTKRR
jgi:hypothetical protein